MNKVRTLTLCLLAAFALTAIAATTASAEPLPAWGKCEPPPEVEGRIEGKYADSGCTEHVGKVYGHYIGGYEWYPLADTSGLGYGEDSKLEYTSGAVKHGILQPVSETTITFADGNRITCGPLADETLLPLTGPHGATVAPILTFDGCHEDASGGECHTLDARQPEEITLSTLAWENGVQKQEGNTAAGPSWNGTMTFIEGKKTSSPVVGIVYRTQEKGEPFMQQLVCESEDIKAVKVGGVKAGEEIVMPIEPVNQMSPSFTAKLRQSAGVEQPTTLEGRAVKPLQALVNAERDETVAFETTMLFPTELYVGPVNHNYGREELELKATP